MITKSEIKKKSEMLEIPFSNLLSAIVCETVIEILCNTDYKKELFLSNGAEFNPEVYKEYSISTIEYEYVKDIDERMEILFLRDILKEIIGKASMEAIVVSGSVEEHIIKLQVTVDDMYVPITILFSKKMKAVQEVVAGKLKLTYYDDKEVVYLENPKEDILVNHLLEIIKKLELINEMDHYYDALEIISKYPINGRKFKEMLQQALISNNIEITRKRLDTIKGYSDYTYMKKKWKVELRQKKRSEPSWTDTLECLMKFLEPIWDCMETNMVFIGDWMPQIKRFLD